jgi:hypothetical protein
MNYKQNARQHPVVLFIGTIGENFSLIKRKGHRILKTQIDWGLSLCVEEEDAKRRWPT